MNAIREQIVRLGESAELDNLLNQSGRMNPFCTVAYGTAMQAQGWEPWVLAVESPGPITATLALLKKGRLSTELEIPSLPVAAANDPFWNLLDKLCRSEGVTDLIANSFASSPFTLPPLRGELSRQSRQEFVLDFIEPDASQTISSNHKRNIKKAKSAGIAVRRTRSDFEWLSDHVRLMNQSVQRRLARGESVPVASEESAFRAFLESNSAELFQAVSSGAVMSSVLVLRSPDAGYYHSAGSSPEGMSTGASHFLIDSIGSILKAEGCACFNLGGAAEGSSLARFKQGFGSRVVPLASAECYVGPAWKRKLRSAVSLMRSDRATLVRSLTGSSFRTLVYKTETAGTRGTIVPPVPDLEVRFLDEQLLRALEPTADNPSFRSIQLERLARCGASYAYGVFCGKKIVHIAWLMPAAVVNTEDPQILDLQADEAELTGCETIADFRGKGIYPFAIQSIVRIASQQGLRRVFMKTQESNLASQHGITKAGLQPCGSVSLIKPPLFPSRTIIRRSYSR